MAEKSIDLKRNDDEVYIIKFAGTDAQIVLDMMDVEFPSKANKAYTDISKNLDICRGNIVAIQNKYKNDPKANKTIGIMTKEQVEISAEYKKMYEKDRAVCDALFGEGTMRAIFGDRNYFTMFNDLFEAILPVINEMKSNIGKIEKRIKKKYGSTGSSAEDPDVLS